MNWNANAPTDKTTFTHQHEITNIYINMKIQKTDIDKLNATLTITVEPQDYEEKVAKQLKDIRHRANIPGFRPGMVPAGLVKKMYGKSVLADEVNKALSEGIYKFITEQKLNVLGDPMPNEDKTPSVDWDNQDTFEFYFDIALAPEFDAKLTEKDTLTYYDITVTDEMVQRQVEGYQSRFGSYDSVEDYKDGDMLRGTLTEQAENGRVIDNQVMSPAYIQNAEQKALFDGAKKGDTIVFNPKKAYENEAELASMLKVSKEEAAQIESDFAFQIENITRHIDAELNQELFDKVYGAGAVADEAGFREKVKAEIAANRKEDSDYKFGLDAKAAIMKKMEGLEFPDEFLKNWVVKTNKDMTEQKVEEDYPKMLEELKWQLAKDQLAEAYEVKVDEKDVTEYAKNITRMQFMQYGLSNVADEMLEQYSQEMLKDENQVRGIYNRVQEVKIYEALKGKVKLVHKEVALDEFSKLFEK